MTYSIFVVGRRLTLSSFEITELVGGAAVNNINASAFSGQTRLYGLTNNDVLVGGNGSDVLVSAVQPRKHRLVFWRMCSMSPCTSICQKG